MIDENGDDHKSVDVDEVLNMKRKRKTMMMMDEIRYLLDRNHPLDFSYDKAQQ